MALYMKKSSFGRLVETDDINDPDLMEVRLSPEEYDYLWDRIHQAEQSIEKKEKEVEERVSVAYQKANRMITSYKKKVKEEAEKRMLAAYKAQREAEEKADLAMNKEEEAMYEKYVMEENLEKQRILNENLKRVCRERANALRKISPKKEKSGYLVLYSNQFKERYKGKEGKTAVADTWKSLLQTPYDASIPLDLIIDDIWDNLMNDVLYQMGFRKIQETEKNGTYQIWTEEDEDGDDVEVCGLYRWCFRANYREGLWEMILYSTKGLSVPAEYRK